MGVKLEQKIDLATRNKPSDVQLEVRRQDASELSVDRLKNKNYVIRLGNGEHKDVQLELEGHRRSSIVIGVNRGIPGKYEPENPYEGPYTVVSQKDWMQIYPTTGKSMTENLVVLPIPYYEVNNIKNGLTVYIGGD